MTYVDGFVIPIKKNKVAAYKKMASVAGKIWKKLGALDYYECVGDDLLQNNEWGVSFLKAAKAKSGETVIFSFIVYKSKSDRDKINANVMKDSRILKLATSMPFDAKRMVNGGFKTLVSLK